MFKTLLCIPPDYDRNFPPLGTPALTAFLKAQGMACSQVDLNLRYREFLAQRVSGRTELNRQERLFFLEPLLTKFFTHNLKGRYYSALLPRTSDRIFPHLPYGNNTNSSFYFTERMLSSGHLWRYLADADENTFHRFYCSDGILDVLEQEDIGLFGISVISPSQAIASLTLGLLVKKVYPHIHVTIGGQWPTLYQNEIIRQKELFRCFDSVVVGEGESALYALARRLERGQEVRGIPNVITASHDGCAAAARRDEDMDALPCPDFDGLLLAEYDGCRDGQISITFETSRGCYWSKCAYCVDLPLPKPSYRSKRADLVVRDMKELRQRYNAGYLLLGDPGLSPRQMRSISRQILDDNFSMEWWTMARLDPGFSRDLFDLAHQAGLKQVNFGFETASDRVSLLLDKGNSRERSSRIIRDCAAAGIKVHLQTMLGLPGESFEDGMETIDFLVSHKEYISSVTFNTYYLTPCNHVYRDPARYGIEYENDPGLPFRFFAPFCNTKGMDMDQAYVLEKMYHSLLRKGGSSEPVAGPLSDGYAELSLNNEICRLRYLRDPRTEVYTFLQDENRESDECASACATR